MWNTMPASSRQSALSEPAASALLAQRRSWHCPGAGLFGALAAASLFGIQLAPA